MTMQIVFVFRSIGASPSGKATVFGIVTPGSNPGAPAIAQRILLGSAPRVILTDQLILLHL